jgi:cell wall-associated NlpC family hydrolase
VPIAPLRAVPKDQGEIVSQLLFGDQVLLLERMEKWILVRNIYDGYEGFVDFKQLKLTTATEYENSNDHTYLAPATPLNALIKEDGSKVYLAAGSNLPAYDSGRCAIGSDSYKVDFEPLKVSFGQPANDVIGNAMFFQHAPYLWGGRTLFGIDCSGFVQIVYKMAGVKLQRDASQQALEGATVHFLPEVQPGDVAFFDNDEGRIIHVGILLNNKEIIHASGEVRIDPIDDQGIYNKELKRYTHKLRIIKRYI